MKIEPGIGAVIMFCYQYANGRIGTVVAIRQSDFNGRWRSTSSLTSRYGVSWGTMQDLFPAIKLGVWTLMTPEDKEFSCG